MSKARLLRLLFFRIFVGVLVVVFCNIKMPLASAQSSLNALAQCASNASCASQLGLGAALRSATSATSSQVGIGFVGASGGAASWTPVQVLAPPVIALGSAGLLGWAIDSGVIDEIETAISSQFPSSGTKGSVIPDGVVGPFPGQTVSDVGYGSYTGPFGVHPSVSNTSSSANWTYVQDGQSKSITGRVLVLSGSLSPLVDWSGVADSAIAGAISSLPDAEKDAIFGSAPSTTIAIPQGATSGTLTAGDKGLIFYPPATDGTGVYGPPIVASPGQTIPFGIPAEYAPPIDTDNDGVPDTIDTDIDGDGIENAEDADANGDGVQDIAQQDNVIDESTATQIEAQTFTAEPFFSHAITTFSGKFPFDIMGSMSGISVSECPSYTFFNETFELCPLRDIFAIFKYPAIIAYAIWSVMAL